MGNARFIEGMKDCTLRRELRQCVVALILCSILLGLGPLGPAAQSAQLVPVLETNLANGLKLLMVSRHDEPTIAGGWVAHVGSANERPGITGTAHLFEH